MLQPETTEPTLINALAVGGGCFVLWMAHTMLQVRDGVRELKQAIYGDPAATEPEGMKVDIGKIRHMEERTSKALDAHITEEMNWRENAERLQTAYNNRTARVLHGIEEHLHISSGEV